MTPPTTVFPSRAWLVSVLLALALAVTIALVAGCSVNVPLGVDPRSDAAAPFDAEGVDAGGS
jgi:hypothetical protein